MTIARIPLAQKIGSRTSSLAKDSYSLNGYFETRDGNREFVKRPGLASFATGLPAGQAQGLWASLDDLWAATSSTVYQIDGTTGVGTSFGAIGSGPVSWNQTSATAGYIFLQDLTNGFYIAPAGSAVVQVANGTVPTYTVTDAGTGYTAVPSATVTGGGGASATANVFCGVVTATPLAAGTVYTVNDRLTFSGTGGTVTTACELRVASVDSNGAILTLEVVTAGVYSVLPTTFTGVALTYIAGSGGTAATATLAWGVSSVTANAVGSGYTSTPVVTVSDPTTTGDFTRATVTPTVSFFPTGPLAYGVVYLDGYMVVATTAGRIYNSSIDDPRTWGALDYISAEAEPDPIIGIAKHFNYIVSFGEWSTEFFYDKGNETASPFARNAAARLEIGCANGGSIVQIEQAVIWVGKSRSHGKSVFIMDGLSPVKISTLQIEKYLNADQTDNVRACSFKIDGHTFYVMTQYAAAPNAHTFVYDVDEKEWYVWANNVGASQTYFSAQNIVEFESTYYGIDSDTSVIYDLATTYYDDAGDAMYCGGITPLLDSGTTKYKFYRKIEVVGDKVSADLTIQHTDDDYQNYSNWRTVDLSVTRSQLYQLGAGRRRAWKWLCIENVPLRLAALEIDFDIGHMTGAEG